MRSLSGIRAATLLFLASVFFLDAPQAFASGVCDYYRQNFPELYKQLCSMGMLSVRPSNVTSALGDGLKFNPSALPTSPSSVGVEAIGSYLRNNPASKGVDFALVKGFQKFGTGLSTSDDNTFYSNDTTERINGPSALQSLAPREVPVGHKTNLDLALAVSLLDFAQGSSVKLGAAARYNKTTGRVGASAGLTTDAENLTMGVSVSREKLVSYLPDVDCATANASARWAIFEIEYKLLRNLNGIAVEPIHILSATATIPHLILTAAIRKLNYAQDGDVVQKHFAIQAQLSEKISLGFLYNYLPGATSLGLQYFL